MEPKPSIVWTYQLYKVGGAETNYRLTIGQFKGVGSTEFHNVQELLIMDHSCTQNEVCV